MLMGFFFCVQCGKQPVSLHFNRFCTHCDYFRKLAPSNEPLRYRTKPSRDFLSHSRSPASLHIACSAFKFPLGSLRYSSLH